MTLQEVLAKCNKLKAMGWKKCTDLSYQPSYRDEHSLSKTERPENRLCSEHATVKFGGFASTSKTDVASQELRVKSRT